MVLKKLLVTCLSVYPIFVSSQNITTATLIRATAQALPHCLHYRVKGACYWWVNDGFLGHPAVTPKLAHYIPDVVVSVFDRAGDNPWLEAHYFYDKMAFRTAKTLIHQLHGLPLDGGRHSLNTAHDTQVRFKEVTIIGNPAAQLRLGYATIAPNATPFVPYFHSLLDVISWRFGVEMLYPASWLPNAHPIGKLAQGFSWGNVYPRDGFVVASNDYQAAAIIAERAADIVTKRYQPHVYHFLKNYCGPHCSASPVKENDPPIRWQRIYPQESHRCEVFGTSRDAGDHLSQKTDGRYVWIVWRYYSGCVPIKGAQYLGETYF